MKYRIVRVFVEARQRYYVQEYKRTWYGLKKWVDVEWYLHPDTCKAHIENLKNPIVWEE